MKIEEFNNTRWTGGMKAIYNGKEYDVLAPDFEKKTIDLVNDDGIEHDIPCERVFIKE